MTETRSSSERFDAEEGNAVTIGPDSEIDTRNPVTPAAAMNESRFPVTDPSQSHVYALGQIDPRFPTLGIEKEYAQITGRRADTALNDRETLVSVLADDDHRYLARNMCWVLMVEGIETYLLRPRDPADYHALIEAVRENPRRDDVDIVIGTRVGLAPPDMCNGLAVPLVVFEQIYSFDRDSLVESIPVPANLSAKAQEKFQSAAGALFDYIMQMADNSGATDEHRAVNYLAVRYPSIYAAVATQQEGNASLINVEVRPSRLGTSRQIFDVVFSFANRQTQAIDMQFVRVDVTELFPFLVSPLLPYYSR